MPYLARREAPRRPLDVSFRQHPYGEHEGEGDQHDRTTKPDLSAFALRPLGDSATTTPRPSRWRKS